MEVCFRVLVLHQRVKRQYLHIQYQLSYQSHCIHLCHLHPMYLYWEFQIFLGEYVLYQMQYDYVKAFVLR
ncbi:MAG: hypothetical protein EBW05_00085 [Betaproteobacteria bacterium]|nr:hypothetical protein [Betaproteobacteria bacterium]